MLDVALPSLDAAAEQGTRVPRAELSDKSIMPRSYGSRIPSLDGLRGVAILIVLFHHWTLLPSGAANSCVLDRVWGMVAGCGWMGVDLFFVLSGFLITTILVESTSDPHYFRNFYARRILRIFPVYYLFLILGMLVIPRLVHNVAYVGSRPSSAWWYILFVSNFPNPDRHPYNHLMGVTWSLSVEEQFYLLWPAVIYWARPVIVKRACVLLILCSLACRIANAAVGGGGDVEYITTPCRMDSLALGAWIALVASTAKGIPSLVRTAKLAGVAGLVGIVVLVATSQARHLPVRDDRWVAPVIFDCVAAVAASLLVLAVHGDLGFLAASPLRFFGRLSFSLYLIHVPVEYAVAEHLGLHSFGRLFGSRLPGQLGFYFVCMTISVSIAWLTWNLYEKRFLQLKRFFGDGSRGVALHVGGI